MEEVALEELMYAIAIPNLGLAFSQVVDPGETRILDMRWQVLADLIVVDFRRESARV